MKKFLALFTSIVCLFSIQLPVFAANPVNTSIIEPMSSYSLPDESGTFTTHHIGNFKIDSTASYSIISTIRTIQANSNYKPVIRIYRYKTLGGQGCNNIYVSQEVNANTSNIWHRTLDAGYYAYEITGEGNGLYAYHMYISKN